MRRGETLGLAGCIVFPLVNPKLILSLPPAFLGMWGLFQGEVGGQALVGLSKM